MEIIQLSEGIFFLSSTPISAQGFLFQANLKKNHFFNILISREKNKSFHPKQDGGAIYFNPFMPYGL